MCNELHSWFIEEGLGGNPSPNLENLIMKGLYRNPFLCSAVVPDKEMYCYDSGKGTVVVPEKGIDVL